MPLRRLQLTPTQTTAAPKVRRGPVLLTFESPQPDGSTGTNAVRFSLAFHGVASLVMRGAGQIRDYAVESATGGGCTMSLRGPQAETSFRFEVLEVVGVRHFRMATSP